MQLLFRDPDTVLASVQLKRVSGASGQGRRSHASLTALWSGPPEACGYNAPCLVFGAVDVSLGTSQAIQLRSSRVASGDGQRSRSVRSGLQPCD